MVKDYSAERKEYVRTFRQYGLHELYDRNADIQLEHILICIEMREYVAAMQWFEPLNTQDFEGICKWMALHASYEVTYFFFPVR